MAAADANLVSFSNVKAGAFPRRPREPLGSGRNAMGVFL